MCLLFQGDVEVFCSSRSLSYGGCSGAEGIVPLAAAVDPSVPSPSRAHILVPRALLGSGELLLLLWGAEGRSGAALGLSLEDEGEPGLVAGSLEGTRLRRTRLIEETWEDGGRGLLKVLWDGNIKSCCSHLINICLSMQ